MDNDDLISRLNWFYNLELNQVDLYKAQSTTFQDPYLKLVYQRIASIEQKHVDNISAEIEKSGGTPSKIGDVIAPIIGHIAGKVLSTAGLENALKANILLEQKAMKDYKSLIKAVEDNNLGDDIIKTLQNNLIDEDLHTAWFIHHLNEEFKSFV